MPVQASVPQEYSGMLNTFLGLKEDGSTKLSPTLFLGANSPKTFDL